MAGNHLRNFSPEKYHEFLVKHYREYPEMWKKKFDALRELLGSARFSGRKLLEIGSGPTLCGVALPSEFFQDIVLSDFVEENCEELRKWLKGESKMDWTPIHNMLAKIEGHEDIESGRREIEARIRKCVTSVVQCDVSSDQVVPPEATTEYDFLVISSFLEIAASNDEEFRVNLQRIGSLLRSGGGLFLSGYLEKNHYSFGGHGFNVTQNLLNEALLSAGFREVDCIVCEEIPMDGTVFCLSARKMFKAMPSSSLEAVRENLHQNFTPKAFNEFIIKSNQLIPEMWKDGFVAIHELFSSGRFKGEKLLELGSGPTVHNIASASAYFHDIVQSDFLDDNCEELRIWLKGESKLDWSPILHVIAEIEGHKNIDSGRREIEARIRKSVTSVVHCDITRDQVVPPEEMAEYDFLVLSAVLESASSDYEQYKANLQRASRLVRSGGGLYLTGFLNQDCFSFGGHDYMVLCVSQDQINEALQTAEFDDVEWHVCRELMADLKYYCLSARKL